MKIISLLLFSSLFALCAHGELFVNFPHLLTITEETSEHDQPLNFTTQDIITFAIASILIMIGKKIFFSGNFWPRWLPKL